MNDLASFNDREFVGSDFEILTELHDEAGYRRVIDPTADDTNLEAHSFPHGSVEKSSDWTTVEGLQDGYEMRDYANVVTVFGSYDESAGEYLIDEARDEDEMNATVPIVPKVIAPGYSYPVPGLEDGNDNVPVLPLESASRTAAIRVAISSSRIRPISRVSFVMSRPTSGGRSYHR